MTSVGLETLQLELADMRPDRMRLDNGTRRLATFVVVVAGIRLQGWSICDQPGVGLTMFPPRLSLGPDRRAVILPDDRWMGQIRSAAIKIYHETSAGDA